MEYIGLIDCNNFFVSCERLFRPDLAHRPVVVLSSNDGCVVARSQEIKDMAIPMGVPYFQIKDTLRKANAAIFSSHFALYRDISRRVFLVVREEVSVLEQYSIDEAFFQYSGTDPHAFGQHLKRQIERRVGVPVSIGLAATKTQAKWATQQAKQTPSGVLSVDRRVFQQHAAASSLGSLWGVGAGRRRSFAQHDISTVADFVAVDPVRVARLWGVAGTRLQSELTGRPAYQVVPRRVPQQSITSSRSFARATQDHALVADALAYHVRRVTADLRAAGQTARMVRVVVSPSRHGAFALQSKVAVVRLPAATADTFVILREAQQALADVWQADVPYQKVGVVVSELESAAYAQQELFTTKDAAATAAVWTAVDAVNQRYGADTVQLGRHMSAPVWHARRDQLSPAYTTRWTDIPTVSAK